MTKPNGLSHTVLCVLTGVEADVLGLLPGVDVDEQALMTYFGGRNDMARTPLVASLV